MNNHNKEPIRVFIVDDSALVRQVLTQLLEKHAHLRVIGMAADPLYAIEKMRKEWPDVLILDLEMPRMDGLTFLRQVMAERATPTLICSSLTEPGTAMLEQALKAGAAGVFTKAKLGLRKGLEDLENELVRSVEHAARQAPARVPASKPVDEKKTPLTTTCGLKNPERIVTLGCSTGGTLALEHILKRLPENCPGIVIVQHMPEKFTADFARRLNSLCQIEVREARHLDRVHSGLALLAPGGLHMQLKRSGAHFVVEVLDGPAVNRHKPSVDVLFRSVARHAGSHALGIIMTGMGDDGARGLLAMREQGASTVAQDEASCVVFGMPKEAIRLGAAQRVEPLQRLPVLISQFAEPEDSR
ncbi:MULTISPECIES: protein-glutamate methylesterase/protein-glutamine glutaminase [Pseudomonas]|jgi:two-component system chemotaxis response regulator CheB|uniref:Protein-glutamate methylesterase/protein-glutamine glutaminase n=1 Tax=Pseudomonas mosselii TaxID=78327 RepID=A0A5R8YXR8_9PSED|nr:chemotaxis response regulator protein-glutamate methylesterase [Pseudomonas mosselii]TLP58240.1 chemotaxis response regulator protein-glutamate methylesterase [Pseudomonas mosselii]